MVIFFIVVCKLLLKLLRCHWLVKLYRFQGYISMIHHPCIALCAHHSDLLKWMPHTEKLKVRHWHCNPKAQCRTETARPSPGELCQPWGRGHRSAKGFFCPYTLRTLGLSKHGVALQLPRRLKKNQLNNSILPWPEVQVLFIPNGQKWRLS